MSSTPTAEAQPTPPPLLVGVVGRAHGLRGELVVAVRTDSPEERFAPGAVLTRRLALLAACRLHALVRRRLLRFPPYAGIVRGSDITPKPGSQ